MSREKRKLCCLKKKSRKSLKQQDTDGRQYMTALYPKVVPKEKQKY